MGSTRQAGQRLHDENCPICTMEAVTTRRTELLFIDEFCFIDRNDSAVLIVGGQPLWATQRITLSLRDHISVPPVNVVLSAKSRLLEYLQNNLALTATEVITRVTMLTVTNHFHVHAYVLPFVDSDGNAIPKSIYSDAYYLRHSGIPDSIIDIFIT